MKEKKELIEEIGLNIEALLGIAPLAARIYALLILSSYEGLTFDEIKEAVQASKSSVSTSLKVLTQLKYIDYHTKPGVRKRYFRVAKYLQLISLEQKLQSLDSQIELIEKINEYNKQHHPEKFVNEQSLGEITQNNLRKYQHLIREAIQEIEAYKLKEQSKKEQ